MPQEIYQHHLQNIELCVVARKGHPVLTKTSLLEDIHHLPIARVVIDGLNNKRVPLEEFYISKGYEANFTLLTHSIRVLVSKLESSDAILYGSNYMKSFAPNLGMYPLPKMPEYMRSIGFVGGYLQTKRGFPLYQLLHQTMQTYFDEFVQPEQMYDIDY